VKGLEAIAFHNGWAISAVGISIVFTGLTLLALIISQLHKVLKLWDERGMYYERLKNMGQKEETTAMPDFPLPQNMEESARQFKLLTERMEDPFSLPELLKLSEKCGLSHPHSTMNALLRSKRIVPDGKGYFHWNE